MISARANRFSNFAQTQLVTDLIRDKLVMLKHLPVRQGFVPHRLLDWASETERIENALRQSSVHEQLQVKAAVDLSVELAVKAGRLATIDPVEQLAVGQSKLQLPERLAKKAVQKPEENEDKLRIPANFGEWIQQ